MYKGGSFDHRFCSLKFIPSCSMALSHQRSNVDLFGFPRYYETLAICMPTEDEIDRVVFSERKVEMDRMMKACLALLVSPQ